MSIDTSTEGQARRHLVMVTSTGLTLALVAAWLAGAIHGEIIDAVEPAGPVAPIAFVLLYAGLSLLLVPGSVLSASGGLLFGTVAGGGLAVAGGVAGATLAFLLGRRLGRRQVEQLAGRRMESADRWLHHHGAVTIAVARIIPGVPYSLLNYAAGVTGMRTKDYVLGTLVGLVPGAFAYAAVGSTATDPLSLEFAGALGLVALVLAAGTLGKRHISPAPE